MAQVMPLQSEFRQMVRDVSRWDMPTDTCWNMVDWIPDEAGAHTAKRGGWAYSISALAGATSTFVAGVADFLAGPELLTIDNQRKFWQTALTATALTASVGTAVSAASGAPLSRSKPVFFQGKMLFAADAYSGSMWYYDGTTAAAVTATGFLGPQTVAAYKSRVVLDGGSNNQNVYFSNPNDIFTYDTTNSWIGTSDRIIALAPLPSVLLIFHGDSTARIRGSIPPPGTDMILDDPVFNVGCTDARSLAFFQSSCIFANPGGVYISNGTSLPVDLTAEAGLKKYWNSIMAGYKPSNGVMGDNWSIAGGVYRNRYYVSVMNGSTLIDAFCFDPVARSGYRLSNLPVMMYAEAFEIQQELYFALRSQPRVARLSPIFAPTSANVNDGDATAVQPVLETQYFSAPIFYRHRYFPDPIPSKKTWRAVYLDYDLEGGSSPSLTVSYARNIEDGYTALTPDFAVTTRETFSRRGLQFPSQGVAFKIVQNGASASTKLTKLAAVVHLREESRVDQ